MNLDDVDCGGGGFTQYLFCLFVALSKERGAKVEQLTKRVQEGRPCTTHTSSGLLKLVAQIYFAPSPHSGVPLVVVFRGMHR